MQKIEMRKRASFVGLSAVVTVLGAGCEADVLVLLEPPAQTAVQQGDRLEFGRLGLNCANPVRSYGFVPDKPTRILRVEFLVGSAFRLNRLPELSLEFTAGQQVPIEVAFVAETAGSYEDTLLIETTTGGREEIFEVALLGERLENASQSDTFIQGGDGENGLLWTDILFVIDDSCSMLEEQRALVRNFAAFIDVTNSSEIDYHIGVTTTDTGIGSAAGRLLPIGGTFSERVVTRGSRPSPHTHFERIAQVGLGGSGSERGMLAAQLALSEELSEDNAGFLREEARLALIFISDERDQSPGFTESYAEFFRSLKASPQMLSAFAIAGARLEGCEGIGGGASAAPRYHELVDRLGGATASICTEDWAFTLANISKAAFGLKDAFPLSQRPEGEIEVFVDGVAIPQERGPVEFWYYHQPSNSVIFNGGREPGAGSEVELRYRVRCDG